jgi:hypothetical protein
MLMNAPAGVANIMCSMTGITYNVNASGQVTVDLRDVPDLLRAGFTDASLAPYTDPVTDTSFSE